MKSAGPYSSRRATDVKLAETLTVSRKSLRWKIEKLPPLSTVQLAALIGITPTHLARLVEKKIIPKARRAT
jgi:hypothetical protein